MAQLEEAAPARFEYAPISQSHVSYTELRQNLKKHLDEVSTSRAPLTITRGKAEPVVMLALGEYEALQETLHLMRDPENVRVLNKSIAEAEAGDFVEFNVDE